MLSHGGEFGPSAGRGKLREFAEFCDVGGVLCYWFGHVTDLPAFQFKFSWELNRDLKFVDVFLLWLGSLS